MLHGLDVDAVVREVLGEAAPAQSPRSIPSTFMDAVGAAPPAAQPDAEAARAIAADAEWAADEALFELAEQSGDYARAAAAFALAQQAHQASLQAGAGLSADAQTRRTQAARQAARQAATDALVAPKDAALGAKMRAWQKVAGAVTGGVSMAPYAPRTSSFLTKVYAGVPVWGWGVGTIALVGGALWLRSTMMHKRRR